MPGIEIPVPVLGALLPPAMGACPVLSQGAQNGYQVIQSGNMRVLGSLPAIPHKLPRPNHWIG